MPAGKSRPRRSKDLRQTYGRLLLSFGSGVAALIYEIVWFQLLELVLGSSAVSLGVLLATFMGGMCLGSLILPRFAFARKRPFLVYAGIELGIGVLGMLMLRLATKPSPRASLLRSCPTGH